MAPMATASPGARQLHDAARDRAFDFHRGLVGHHIGQRLVFADGVALGHMPAGDFGRAMPSPMSGRVKVKVAICVSPS
jgi:hypothetical protein